MKTPDGKFAPGSMLYLSLREENEEVSREKGAKVYEFHCSKCIFNYISC